MMQVATLPGDVFGFMLDKGMLTSAIMPWMVL